MTYCVEIPRSGLQGEVLPDYAGGGEGRDFGDVVGRGDFDHVHALEVESAESLQGKST